MLKFSQVIAVKKYIFLLLLVFSSMFALGQRSPFNAGVVVGLNASQINGDNAAGFTKLGLKAGLQGVVEFSERWNITIEMLYSQRGSQDDADFFGVDGVYTQFKLNYFEFPIYFELLDWEVDDYYKMHFIGGVSYAILRDAKIRGSLHTPEVLNDRDWSLFAGIDFFANRHMGGGIRFTYSVSELYSNQDNNPNLPSLRSYFLSFHTFYRIK